VVVPVASQADLSVTKTVSASAGTVGMTFSYVIVFANLGPSNAQNVTLTDSLGAGMSITAVASSVAGGSVSAITTSSSLLQVTTATLVAGAAGTITLTVSVNSIPTGSLTNAVSITSTTPDPVPANNRGTLTSSAAQVVDMVTTVQLGSGTSTTTITGTVTYSNAGPITATGVTATLQLTPGLTSVLLTSSVTVTGVYNSVTGVVTLTGVPATLASGQTLTLSLVITAPVTITTVQAFSTITSALPDTNTANNTATAIVGLTLQSDVSVSLALTAASPASSTAQGTVTFYNLGNTAANNVTRSVFISGGTVTGVVAGGSIAAGSVTATFNVATMPVGSSSVYTFTYAMPTSGIVAATASVATTTTETNTANNKAIGVTVVSGVGVDLSVSLSVSPALLVAGTNTVFVTVTNVGASASTGTLTVGLPPSPVTGSSVTFSFGLLSPGQKVAFTTTYVLASLTTASQTFTATVSSGSGAEVNLTNNSTTLVVGIGASLKGRAWIDTTRNRRYDVGETLLPNLLVKLYNSTSVVVGTAFTSVSTNPATRGTYEIVGMPAGGGYRLEFFSCVNPSQPATCSVIGTTPINGTASTQFGQASTGSTTVTTSMGGSTVGQAISGITLYPGDNTVDQNLPIDPSGIVYDSQSRLPVANARIQIFGPGGALVPAANIVGGQNTVFTGSNGFYQFWLQGLAAGDSGTYTLVVTAPAGYSPATVTSTTFAVLGGVVAPTSLAPVPGVLTAVQAQGDAPTGAQPTTYHLRFGYNFAAAVGDVINNHIPLDAIPSGAGGGVATSTFDLSLAKAGPATLVVGATGTYTLVLTNAGPTLASNVTLTDVMPPGLALLSAAVRPANALVLTVSAAGLVATTQTLAIGVTTVTLVVQAVSGTPGNTITNVASVATTTTESTTVNNVASAVTRLVGIDVGILKRGPATLAAGGTATYELTVFNAGPSAAANVTVTDVMPPGLTLLSATVISGSFTLVTSSASLVAIAPSLAAGTSLLSLTVGVADTLAGTVTNVARVTSTTPDIQLSNNTATATATVLGADIGVLKFGSASISAASTATYTLVIFNNGPSSAGNVTVTDVMPTGLALVKAEVSSASFTLAITPQQLTGSAALLRIGTTVTLTLTVQVDYTATGTITNIANVTSTTPDPTPTNNIGSATSVVKEVEPGVILVNKTGNKTVAEVGDSVQYTIRMRNTVAVPVNKITLEDLLPAGFRYIPGTSRLNGTTTADPGGGVGRQLLFDIGTIPGGAVFELTYFVRLGVGSQQGDGINRATAIFPGARGMPVRSNTALFKVNVQGGVFSNEGCIVGKVYMDCDGNSAQGNTGGSRELGIPGVRLVMLDGSFIVTDNEGKYSLCGVKPQTSVIKVDRATLPRGARLLPSSNRNAGVGDSIFVDMKGGELVRADFIEGSCSPEVLEQVKARRAQGGVNLPQPDRLLPLQAPGSSGGLGTAPPAAGGVWR
jgi:uncharacterized repeat protein (TIGR01451 family)